MVKTPKRAGQSFDLAVAAVTIESMGVTPGELHGRFMAFVITVSLLNNRTTTNVYISGMEADLDF